MIDPHYDYKELHENRACGILLPVFSLPSLYGIGSFGKTAYTFIDFLKKARQRYWQLLPLCPTGFGNSPYSPVSSFAGNPYFIDIDMLYDQGLLTVNEKNTAIDTGTNINYGMLYRTRLPLLYKAYYRFLKTSEARQKLHAFSVRHKQWLPDYALFSAIRGKFGDTAWFYWPADIKQHDTAAVTAARTELAEQIDFFVFLQYLFETQWIPLKAYAKNAGIQIIGDLPIYSAHDSAEVWSNKEVFCVEYDGTLAFESGCPPADFENPHDTGQVWGTPVYNWEYLERTGFEWLIQRFSRQTEFYDVLRLDHFRGYEQFWKIPFGAAAREGQWADARGMQFFTALRNRLPHLQIIAEDLGFLTEDVCNLRKAFKYPSMRILQHGLCSVNEHTPHHYDPHSVVYFGIHDNEPIPTWLKNRSKQERAYIYEYLQLPCTLPPHLALARAMVAFIADTVIFQVQDILLMDGNTRINTPGSDKGNWELRLHEKDIARLFTLSSFLKKICVLYGR